MTRSPFLKRFLSDFTLGFSDGLTVPFALTAGLSSLGRTDTVIYAGLAELCAGSISMGIGGYLAALDEIPSSGNESTRREETDEEELRGMLHDGSSAGESSARESMEEKAAGNEEEEQLIRRHLEPLALSSSTLSSIISTLGSNPDGLKRAALRLQSHNDSLAEGSDGQHTTVWPVVCGLSISLGYVIGGIIPLLPYFFAATVGLGLRWSIGLCLLALMSFGSGKTWILGGEGATSWRRCLWSGMQMLVLGSLAAAAAVLCVNLLGADVGESGG